MIEMLRVYSKAFSENVTIEELPPGLSAERNTQTDDLEDSFLKSTSRESILEYQISSDNP